MGEGTRLAAGNRQLDRVRERTDRVGPDRCARRDSSGWGHSHIGRDPRMDPGSEVGQLAAPGHGVGLEDGNHGCDVPAVLSGQTCDVGWATPSSVVTTITASKRWCSKARSTVSRARGGPTSPVALCPSGPEPTSKGAARRPGRQQPQTDCGHENRNEARHHGGHEQADGGDGADNQQQPAGSVVPPAETSTSIGPRWTGFGRELLLELSQNPALTFTQSHGCYLPRAGDMKLRETRNPEDVNPKT